MNDEIMVCAILEIVESKLESGAEVARVEDSVERMCTAYGYTKTSISIVSANIFITTETPEGNVESQMRSTKAVDINFEKLNQLNNLSRAVCADVPEIEDLQAQFKEVEARREPPLWLEYLGAWLIGASFAVFFGGTYYDGLASAVLCLVIFTLTRFLSKFEQNPLASVFFTSVISGFIALAMVRLGFGDNSDKIIIGGLMLLIPGVHMTNSIRDLLAGDVISGFFRLVNALLIAAAIACGVAIPIILTGGGAI